LDVDVNGNDDDTSCYIDGLWVLNSNMNYSEDFDIWKTSEFNCLFSYGYRARVGVGARVGVAARVGVGDWDFRE
jgi:hypothetical protein